MTTSALALAGATPTTAEIRRLHVALPGLGYAELLAVACLADEAGGKDAVDFWLLKAHSLALARERQEHRKDTAEWKDAQARLGLTDRRARELAQAWDTYGSGGIPPEPDLPIGFYVEALRAEEPLEALDLARRRRADDPTYHSGRFRRDLRALRPRAPQPAVAADDPDEVGRLHLPLSRAVRFLAAAIGASRPVRHYRVERVAAIVGEDDAWPAVVRFAQWILNVEAARQELARPQPAVALPGQADVAD